MSRCFTPVARSGSLAAAAETLGRTPSAASMMLKQFGDNLRSPLFETERKSKLTVLDNFALGEAIREMDHSSGSSPISRPSQD
ncbi:MAG TPA: LysR family transcriptional regulator [Aurantimonas coralicida]|uniref:LysR family transcriptional regulator n=1 Tax=Aurantimonas coralicida TaxID=182270 RepID=A0A9C9NHJ6_9HYPH|nr:LysR family transcriptional regulator [Aurantimonas coralicida]HEU01616.1 LysR family transcriptional regulator [Aurantimonas coralicida]